MLREVFLAKPVRTPIGAFCGVFTEVSAASLGATVVRAALPESVPAEDVDEVIMGNVVGAGTGQNVARQCSLGGGLPVSVGATTVNRVCGSGLKAVIMAAQSIQAQDSSLVVAGGTESMSRAPYLLERARSGYRIGHGKLIDAMIHDGLWDVYNDIPMGTCGDRTATRCGIGRKEQDDYAVRSYTLARDAAASGKFDSEIVPVEVIGRKGSVTVERDEGPEKFDEKKLRELRPAFDPDGTVTAGNASTINDGAAAVVVCGKEAVERYELAPVARILGYTTFSREPEWFSLAPIGAIDKLIKQLGWSTNDVDCFEINEAFAVVVLAALRELELPLERINVHGGAISLGHPIGASGTRTLVTLLGALEHSGGRTGIVCLCVGGGEAVALAVERI